MAEKGIKAAKRAVRGETRLIRSIFMSDRACDSGEPLWE
jgi:hypothetical protein